jgi:uncharacterized protein YndB with AHSA1/START domain
MKELKIVIIAELNVDPSAVYNTWLNSDGHEKMTGGGANFTAEEGASYTAWDGYISGEILKLEPNKSIIQTWRTTEFKDSTPDSIVAVTFTPSESGTLFTLRHTELGSEAAVEKYRIGWEDHYIKFMINYFNSKVQ